nr:uncharacterized protein LOC108078975 [Drosophila kikkawai]
MSAPKNTECETPTVREVQQMFAELLCHGDDITWDLYSENQAEILKKKVKDFEDPQEKSRSLPYCYYNPGFFKSIWMQRQFNNGQSLSALFFVMIVDNISDPKEAEESRSWSLYPVFRCRRCVDDNTGRNFSSQECCMVYVTQYESFEDWDKFVKSTRLPKGYMVTPFRGVYKLIDGQVELKTYYIWERSNTVLPTGQDRCITPKSLAAATKCPSHGGSADKIRVLDVLPTSKLCVAASTSTSQAGNIKKGVYQVGLLSGISIVHKVMEWRICSCDRILYLLLSQREGQKSSDASELSDSLLLFTHTTKNLQLALDMIKEQSYRNVLGNELKRVFDKISEESKRIEGKVDLIRSANEVPSKSELDNMFKPKSKVKGRSSKKESKECIKLEDFDSALKEHILNRESFDDLISSLSNNLEPEMLKLIVKLTQTFVENTREELYQLLKYHFPTETIMYRIIVCILKRHSDLNTKKIEEQSSDILRRVRYYFASICPNSRLDLLTKCPKCVGYYHISKNM